MALLRGDLDGAETAADEGAGHVRRSGRYRHGIFVYPALLSTLALQGRRIDVFDALAEWRSQLPPNEAATSPPLLAAETAALLDLGELSTAAAAFGSIDLRLDRLALTVPYLAAVSIEAAWRLGGDRDVGREAAVIDQAVDQGGRVTSTGAIDLHLATGTAQALAGDHLTALATIDRGVDDARRAGALTSLTRLLVRRLAVSDAAGVERDLALDAECEQLVERLALPGLARRLAALGRSRSLPPAVGGRVESHVWFTDLVDSTGHARRMGDRAFTDLATRLERALVGVAGRRGGDILSGITLGDGAVALFADGAEAVRAGFDAVEAARRLGVEIYVGIDTGPVVIERHRAYGTTVNTAARFCDAAEPGEVAVSTRVAETLDGDPTIEFVHRGTTPMKGIDGDQAVFTARHTTTEGNDDDHPEPAP